MTTKKHKKPLFWQELSRDWATLKSLRGKQRLVFLWDYYRWRILACIGIIITASTFASILWEGQKPCRLRVRVALSTEADCSPWFSSFTENLQADKIPGAVDVNFDQLFDPDSPYHYAQQMEVMAAVSSRRVDAVICGKDLYRYLLALNACFPLDKVLSDDLFSSLSGRGMLVYDTANLTEEEDGQVNPEDGIDGCYAVELSGTEFYNLYNRTCEEEGTEEPLYAVIISNTEHPEDCETLLRALVLP